MWKAMATAPIDGTQFLARQWGYDARGRYRWTQRVTWYGDIRRPFGIYGWCYDNQGALEHWHPGEWRPMNASEASRMTLVERGLNG